jgi:ParB family chromosome partitioning protein
VAQMSDGKVPVKRRKKKLKLAKSADIRKLENDLISIFGTKVFIAPKQKGGTIEISYFSDDDLERLLELFSEIED